jgi:hypothetical protein
MARPSKAVASAQLRYEKQRTASPSCPDILFRPRGEERLLRPSAERASGPGVLFGSVASSSAKLKSAEHAPLQPTKRRASSLGHDAATLQPAAAPPATQLPRPDFGPWRTQFEAPRSRILATFGPASSSTYDPFKTASAASDHSAYVGPASTSVSLFASLACREARPVAASAASIGPITLFGP